MKEKKPISPFLRAKHTSAGLGEGGSGLNKHIRFNEKGEAINENGDVKEEEEEELVVKTNGTTEDKDKVDSELLNSSSKTQNGHNDSAAVEKSDGKSTPKEIGVEKGAEEGSEKENQDTNGVEKESQTCSIIVYR